MPDRISQDQIQYQQNLMKESKDSQLRRIRSERANTENRHPLLLQMGEERRARVEQERLSYDRNRFNSYQDQLANAQARISEDQKKRQQNYQEEFFRFQQQQQIRKQQGL